MKTMASFFTASVLALSLIGPAAAQSSLTPAPQNVLQLQSVGSVQVQQDLLVLTLSAVQAGKDANAVQAQLKQALDAALAATRSSAEASKMEVRTGAFSLSPSYNDKRQITGWQGRAELVLEGRDFSRITAAAATATTMTISSVAFDLSGEQRAEVEQGAQTKAIAQFKRQAEQLSKEFGFSSYQLREVSVDSSNSAHAPRQRMVTMSSPMSSSQAPVAVEPGKAEVSVTVSGSVQMQ